MQRYWWPGYEVQLLGELQRQQNSAQFCDTLLQTEGISVPTHSCIIAALSPYLSQRLSAAPCPPSGQKRQVRLQAVKAQTLLKLVGLLYSGKLEVQGSVEQNDVLSAARQFGITELVEGQSDAWLKEGAPQKRSLGRSREKEEEDRKRERIWKMQDAQVQTEMAGWRAADSPTEKRSCVSTGTQTVNTGGETVGTSFTHSSQAKPTRELAPSVSQSLDVSISLQPLNLALDKYFCSPSLSPIPSLPGGAPSNGEPTLGGTSDGVQKTMSTSALSSNAMTLPISLDGDSDSPTAQDDGSYQHSSERETDGKMADSGAGAEQPGHATRGEMLAEHQGKSPETRHVHGMKSLAKMKQMQQMMETTQISIKVKLRRRTKGEVWEVVSMQDTDETLSVLTSLKQDGSKHKRPQADLPNGEPPPSSVQPGPIHKPERPIFQAEPPPHLNTACDSQPPSSDCLAPNQTDGLEPVPLPQPAGPVEESDEQIEKLLEDIMMGLNILPNLERDCKKSHHLQPSHGGAPAICQLPVTENDGAQSGMHAAVAAAECVCLQDFGTSVDQPTADAAQYQPSCSSLPSVQTDAALIQQQQQQQQQLCSPRHRSSVTSRELRDGTSHPSMPLFKSPHPEASVIPTAFWCREPSSQGGHSLLEFLPLTSGNEACSLPCMDDFRLPLCLSPLEPSALSAKQQPVLSSPANLSCNMLPQPSLLGRSWLTENPGLLQFPLSAVTHRANKSASLPNRTNTNRSCRSKRRQRHLQLNPEDGGTRAGSSCSVKEEGTDTAGHQDAEERPDLRKEGKESLKCNQGDAAAPKQTKRKCTSHPQDASGTLLANREVKVRDGTNSQLNLGICSVSLSSNNVLAKEREMAISFSHRPSKFVGKPNEPLIITECQRERTRGPEDLEPGQTRIRTRGFLKKTQETPSNTSLEDSPGVTPIARRKPGRPRKTKLEESFPPIGDGRKRRCNKRTRNGSDVEVTPLKKNICAENTGEAKAANKRRRMVTLKAFQKLIKCQHSKTRKSKESRDKETNETARSAESELKACSSRWEELTKKPEMGIDSTLPQNRDGIKESRVVINVTVDKNHNQIFNKSAADYSKSQRDDDVFGEEVARLAAERQQPLKGPDEAQEACDAAVSDTTQHTSSHNKGLSPSDTHPPQEDSMDHDLNPQNGPPLSDTVGFIKSSGCDQEEEEEVDVLLYSPDKVPQTRECEDGLIIDITPEEEEEEELDVLLYSPDKVPQTRDCEDGLIIDITPEEEEEVEEEEKEEEEEELDVLLNSPDKVPQTRECKDELNIDITLEEEEEVDVLLYSPDIVPQTRECEDGLNIDITPEEEEELDVNDMEMRQSNLHVHSSYYVV